MYNILIFLLIITITILLTILICTNSDVNYSVDNSRCTGKDELSLEIINNKPIKPKKVRFNDILNEVYII